MPGSERRHRLILLLVGLAVVLGVYAWCVQRGVHQIDTGMGDFRHFYFAAKAMRDGQDIYASRAWGCDDAPLREYLEKLEAQTPGSGQRAGYIYPPLLAWMYQPLALLSFPAACRVWLVLAALVSAATVWLMSREAVRRLRESPDAFVSFIVMVVAVAVFSDKIRAELRMGQTNLLMLLGFVLALRWMDKRPWLAGLALGAAFNIKYLPIVLLPYFLLRRRWALSAWFLVGVVAFSLLPALSVGWETNMQYLSRAYAGLASLVGLAPPGAVPGAANVEDIRAPFNLSITCAIARRLPGENVGTLALGVGAAIALVPVVGAIVAYRLKRVPVLAWPGAIAQRELPWRTLAMLEWGTLLTLVFAFSPQMNMRHMYMDLIAVVPAVAAAVCGSGRRRGLAIAAIAITWAGLSLPPGGVKSLPFTADDWRMMGGPAIALIIAQGLMLWRLLGWRGAAATSDQTPRSA